MSILIYPETPYVIQPKDKINEPVYCPVNGKTYKPEEFPIVSKDPDVIKWFLDNRPDFYVIPV